MVQMQVHLSRKVTCMRYKCKVHNPAHARP